MARLPHQANCVRPPENLFNSFAFPLAQLVAAVAGRAPINRTPWSHPVLWNVQCDLPPAEGLSQRAHVHFARGAGKDHSGPLRQRLCRFLAVWSLISRLVFVSRQGQVRNRVSRSHRRSPFYREKVQRAQHVSSISESEGQGSLY